MTQENEELEERVYTIRMYFTDKATKKIDATADINFRIFPSIELIDVTGVENEEEGLSDENFEWVEGLIREWIFKYTNRPVDNRFSQFMHSETNEEIGAWECTPEFDDEAKHHLKRLSIMEDL